MKTISRVLIHNGRLEKDGRTLATEQSDFQKFALYLYDLTKMTYPKFFKMDNLSKLGVLAAELLLADSAKQLDWNGEQVGIMIFNQSGSLNTDIAHYQSIADRDNYHPSPSIFVYTLANIMLGEICIRHQITGENTCLMMEYYDEIFMNKYAENLLKKGIQSQLIAGWIDFKSENYRADLSLLQMT